MLFSYISLTLLLLFVRNRILLLQTLDDSGCQSVKIYVKINKYSVKSINFTSKHNFFCKKYLRMKKKHYLCTVFDSKKYCFII